MRNILKSLFIVLGCLISITMGATSLYKTDFIANPTGATTSVSNGAFENAPNWATGYTNCFHTTSSSGAVTINFTTPIDLSGYTNCQLSVAWGSVSNRPLKASINGGSDVQIDNIGSSSDRSKVRIATSDLTVSSVSSIKLSGSGGGNSYYMQIEITGEAAGPVAVTGVSLNSNSETLEVNQTVQLIATVIPSDADNQNVTWSSSNNNVATVTDGLVTAIGAGTATITVTTEDGNKTATCTVNVTTPAAPIPVTAISLTDASVSVGNTATLTVTYTPEDANTGKAISSWTSSNNAIATVANGVVTGVSAGTATITATTEGGKSASCTVTVTVIAVTGVSLDKSTASIQIGGSTTLTATVLPADASNKAVTWSSDNSSVATVGSGVVTGIAAGTATITVASVADPTKKATCTVTVTAGPPVPPTSLLIHQPEKYEGKMTDGGYGTKLTVIDGHEYEVYYTERTSEGDYPTFSTTLAAEGKTTGISGSTTSSKNVGRTGDTWFEGTINAHSECKNASSQDEFVFGAKMIREHRLSSSNTYKFHVQGYDQFSLWGMDKKLDPKNGNQVFVVKVDGVEQPIDGSLYNTSNYTIRRFDISTREHLIEVSTTAATGTNTCNMGGFSLRVPQAPKIKYLKGDDSAQVVLQTMPINKVVYTCKYNHIDGAETRLVWDGQEATGISLGNIKQGEFIDTLSIIGNANCPVGTYNYAVVTYLHGAETSRVTGKFEVKADIRAMSSVKEETYQNEEMDPITFKYYALSAEDVQLTWTQGKPQGSVDGHGTQPGEYVISGTPTEIGTYPFEITVANADTVIKGTLTVKEITYGDNAVLYLYKNDLAYTKDGVYNYLHDGGTYNPISRRAKMDGLRPSNQYANYKWVLISEDVDADNPEILALARGEGNLPVLNMKGFSYTKDRLNWGDPNNGSLTKAEGRYITVLRDDHPIFKALNKKQGDRIQVLDSTGNKGLMPISVNYAGTLCLATARTRDINDYNGDGPEETFLHEVPAEMHRNQKYLCLPIGQSGTNYLHADGKRLIDECIKYILSNDATIQLPDLAITRFQVGSYSVVPDDNEGEILLEVLAKDSDMLKAATPVVTLASPMTHAYPSVTNADGTVDFTNWRFGVQYIVSDYINKRSYDVVVRIKAAQGIDEIEVGEWINIYDIYGRKVATTNEDFRTMDLPRGMYILVTESGKTLKVMR